MMNEEFSRTSHAAAIVTAAQHRQAVLQRGRSQVRAKKKISPCERCVRLYGSERCWEQWLVQTSLIHGRTVWQAHHHRRPSILRSTTVTRRVTRIASTGQRFGVRRDAVP